MRRLRAFSGSNSARQTPVSTVDGGYGLSRSCVALSRSQSPKTRFTLRHPAQHRHDQRPTPDLTPAPVTVSRCTISIDQFQDAGVVPALGPTTRSQSTRPAGQNNKPWAVTLARGTPVQIFGIISTGRTSSPTSDHPGCELGNNRTAAPGGLVPDQRRRTVQLVGSAEIVDQVSSTTQCSIPEQPKRGR